MEVVNEIVKFRVYLLHSLADQLYDYYYSLRRDEGLH